jgi:hypothetical protein
VAGKLERLHLRAGSMSLGTIAAPNLRELRIETGGFDRKCLASITKAAWPKLESLSLWFGSPSYDGNCTVGDVAKLLARLPSLTHLGLANSTFGDELVEHVLAWKHLPKLRSLDLSKSHVTSAGAAVLVKHAKRLAHLERLDLSECLLDKKSAKLVASLAKSVDVREQSIGGGDDDYRYCAVSE